MSFQVSAGGDAPPASTTTTTYASKSPNQRPAVPGGSPATGPAMDPAAKQRRGTDPSKFKTSICRNWEASGVCNFRGCTFAHGSEDLRTPGTPSPNTAPSTPPVMPPPLPSHNSGSSQSTPHHGPAQPPLPRSRQQGGQPAAGSASEGTTRRVVPSAAPSASSAASANRGASTSPGNSLPEKRPEVEAYEVTATAVNLRPPTGGTPHLSGSTPPFGSTPPLSSGSAPPPPPPYTASNARSAAPQPGSSAAASGFSSKQRASGTNSPTPPNLSTMGTNYVVEALLMEVATVRELIGIHADANQSLEASLAHERGLRRDAQGRIAELKDEAARLKSLLDARRAELAENGMEVPPLRAAATKPPLNLAAAEFVPTGNTPPLDSAPAPAQAVSPLAAPAAPSKEPETTSSKDTPESAATDRPASDPALFASGTVASPTDSGQQDRLRQLLQQLDMGSE